MSWPLLLLLLPLPSLLITCWKCASHNAQWGCLDPFDFQPFVQVNCDYEPWVRDRKPVFCEKRTDVVDDTWVQYEDVGGREGLPGRAGRARALYPAGEEGDVPL